MSLGAILVSTSLVCLATLASVAGRETVTGPTPQPGEWHAWFDSPGGELAFGLRVELTDDPTSPRVSIHNGPESIAVTTVNIRGDEVHLRLDSYDSWIDARLSEDRRRMSGTWSKTSSGGSVSQLPFHAMAGGRDRIANRPSSNTSREDVVTLADRYRVKFESDDIPAVGVFERDDDGHVLGTFMTATGDYRFLAGSVSDNTLTLSCFDGGHAFLFRATIAADGRLDGDFWSRDVWHETWTAVPDPHATLSDAFTQTVWAGSDTPSADLEALVFPDLTGTPRSVGAMREPGQPMIVKVFGSWCPNCHDAADHLAEIHRAHRDDGLAVVGLAFEYTEDFERSVRQVRAFAEAHEVEFPILVAGLADKTRATEALRILDRVRSYPTTIFISGDGSLRAIHTGYTGPATGAAHEHMRERFDAHIRAMLNDTSSGGE